MIPPGGDFYPSLHKEMENMSIRFIPIPSKHPLSPQLAGCSSCMSTPIFPFSLSSWKGSCITCFLMDLPLPQVSSGRTYGMAPRIPGPWPPPNPIANSTTPLPQPKCQFIKAVHVEVAKEYKGIAADLVCKLSTALPSTCTTNLMMKLVPLYSNHFASMQQDIFWHTITKHAQCLAVFDHISNPYIDCLDECSGLLSNHSVCFIALSYWVNQKAKTFLSLGWDHSTGQVIFTYPCKYWGIVNSREYHLVKYKDNKKALMPSTGSTMLA